MESNVIYAKSEENGATTLLDHSVECAKNCLKLAEYAIKEGVRERELLIDMCVFAGMFHDLGKCSDDFQRRVRGEEVEISCVHNVASTKFLSKYLDIRNNDSNVIDAVQASIANHHPIPNGKDKYIKSEEYDVELVQNLIHELVSEYKKLRPNSLLTINIKDDPFDSKIYKEYYIASNNLYNIYLFVVGNILKYADIATSSSKDIKLDTMDDIFNDINIIERKPEKYDDRFFLQDEFSKRLSEFNISCFNSQTGFGKTMLGIMYIVANGKKAYWVCPRNTIASSIYDSVSKEIEKLGLSDRLSVALLLSNEYKHGTETSDIIVTNIDNYIRPQFKTDSNIRSFDMLNRTCIFDEFHEYLSEDAILALYDITMRSRKLCKNSRTLLLSATPIDQLYRVYIDSDSAYIKYNCEKIISRKKHLLFGDKNIPSDVKGKNYFLCTNSVSKCQEIYMKKCTDNIIHARYTDEDRAKKFSILYKTHNKDAYELVDGNSCDDSSWVGNRVVSTGCDISFNNTVFYQVIPEMLLQGLGRNDRWGKLADSGIIPDVILSYNKSEKSENKAVETFYDRNITERFYSFLNKKFGDDSIITLSQLYDARDEFYMEDDIKKMFSKYYKDTLYLSYSNLSNIDYSYSKTYHDDNQSGAVYISNKPSLRTGLNVHAMWIKTYDTNGKPTMNDIMQSDDTFIELDKLFDNNKNIKNIKTIIIKNNLVKEYFGTSRNMEKLLNAPIELCERMKNLSICSETPLILANLYSYNSDLGLFKNKNQK